MSELSMDAFLAASKPRRAVCHIVKVLDALDPKKRAVLEAALANDDVTHAGIEKVLTDNGFQVRQGSIARHRRGSCACEG